MMEAADVGLFSAAWAVVHPACELRGYAGPSWWGVVCAKVLLFTAVSGQVA